MTLAKKTGLSNRSGDDLFVRSIALRREVIEDLDAYPFSIPAIRHLDELTLDSRVTLFAGENGSGKSTLVEAIAVAAGFNPAGRRRHLRVSPRSRHPALPMHLRPRRGRHRPPTCYLLRS